MAPAGTGYAAVPGAPAPAVSAGRPPVEAAAVVVVLLGLVVVEVVEVAVGLADAALVGDVVVVVGTGLPRVGFVLVGFAVRDATRSPPADAGDDATSAAATGRHSARAAMVNAPGRRAGAAWRGV
jgi:hypothetical protein